MENDVSRVFDALPVLTWTVLPDGQVDFLNRHWCEYTGLSLHEASGQGWQRAIHPQDLPELLERWPSILASGESGEMQARLRHFDGEHRWFLICLSPLADTTGQVVRWLGISTDIDDQKRAKEVARANEELEKKVAESKQMEERLRESESALQKAVDEIRKSEIKLRRVIDTIPTLAWCNLADGPNEFLNKGWHEYTGLSPEQSHGWGWQVAFHPEDLPRLLKKWGELLASGEPGEIEARLRRYDGVYRWFLIRVEPFLDDAGKIARWYGTSTDIEDRKLAEAALQVRERDLSLIVNTIPALAWSARPDGHAEFYNQHFINYVGLPLEQLQGWGWITVVHPDDVSALTTSWQSIMAAGKPGETEARLRRFDGEYRWFLLRANPLRDVSDNIVKWYGTNTDIDDRKRVEQDLRHSQAELAHASRITSLGVLMASITHEVNQPLTGIITNAGTCLRMLSTDPPNVDGARETARRTIRDVNRATAVITRLRALYSKKEPSAEPLDLNEAVREVIALSLSRLQRDGVVLRQELADDLPLVIGDRVQLQQVILNLVLNASDAMSSVDDRPRQLVIRTEQEQDRRLRLTVQDAGIGIQPEAVPKLFEPFHTTKASGMGIGLSVSRSIIESHHGQIWAASNDGPGATFSFSIPSGPAGVTLPARRAFA